ncbi:tetratricopeptide repeat protein [Paraburkholderia kururiensis]|uniref:tetratricopeptide repeat protein n=1 Tax=Paraburkholderia kururiensis TaxID=984307 RepID=UPI000694CCEA
MQAFQWMEKAAKQGDINSEVALAGMYATGDGVPKDAEKSAFWTRKTAEQGHPGSQKLLGLMYESGAGVPKDFEQARYWYTRAATQRVDQREASSAQEYLDSLNHRLAAGRSTR